MDTQTLVKLNARPYEITIHDKTGHSRCYKNACAQQRPHMRALVRPCTLSKANDPKLTTKTDKSANV